MNKPKSTTRSHSHRSPSRENIGQPPLQSGVLVPLNEVAASVPIVAHPTLIGSDPSAHVRLSQDSSPTRLALLFPGDGHCYLEDLGTSSGTFLNGTRVRACRVVPGDILRFGTDSQWRFETRCVPNDENFHFRTLPPALQSRVQDEFLVTFWGCRGSMPMSGPHMNAIGGQSTCLEIRYKGSIFLIDAGTGLFRLNQSWKEEFSDSLDFHLFFTHLHWDHIQSFPFFAQAYRAGNRIRIHGAAGMAKPIEASLRQLMEQHHFPVGMDAMQATFSFDEVGPETTLGGLTIRTFPVPHPGGSTAYRFTSPLGTFLFATDCELDHLAINREAVEANQQLPREYPEEMLEFFRGVDVLVVDCQYSDEQYAARCGWGHNSVSSVIDLCSQTRPGRVGLTHHDPLSDDLTVARNVERVRSELVARFHDTAPGVFAAREEMTLSVSASPQSAG